MSEENVTDELLADISPEPVTMEVEKKEQDVFPQTPWELALEKIMNNCYATDSSVFRKETSIKTTKKNAVDYYSVVQNEDIPNFRSLIEKSKSTYRTLLFCDDPEIVHLDNARVSVSEKKLLGVKLIKIKITEITTTGNVERDLVNQLIGTSHLVDVVTPLDQKTQKWATRSLPKQSIIAHVCEEPIEVKLKLQVTNACEELRTYGKYVICFFLEVEQFLNLAFLKNINQNYERPYISADGLFLKPVDTNWRNNRSKLKRANNDGQSTMSGGWN